MRNEAETVATLGAVVRTLSDENDRLRAAVDEVRHQHRPREADDWTSYKGYCSDEACGWLSPCPTIRTLDAALSVPTKKRVE
jgi:hypothetical protein